MNFNSDFETFGLHLMLDGYDCDPGLLRDKGRLTTLLDALTRDLGMHQLMPAVVLEVGAQNRKDPGGLSGFVLVAESHLSCHTFPNRKFVTIDAYTCQSDWDVEKVTATLAKAFQIGDFDRHVQQQGVKYPAGNLV